MKENKASGLDQIPAEIYKHGGQRRLEHLRSLMARIWNDEDLPNQLKDAIIVTVFKKVDESNCDNYRGISLLATGRKYWQASY